MTTILKTILIITIINQQSMGQYVHKKLNNTGIFFEKLNKVNFFNSQLTILTTINLPETRQLTESLINCANNFKIICDEIRIKNPSDLCKPLSKEVEWHIYQVQKDDIKLKERYGKQKRGLIDVGGKFQKFLFGTMDADDSQKIYKELEKLKDRQANIIKLENQHIAVLQSNFDALSKPITQLQNETFEIEDKLNQIIEQNKDIEQKINTDHRLTELISLIMVQCLHINKLQEEAAEIIAALENKHLHPLVIPFTKLCDLIKKEFPDINDIATKHETIRRLVDIDYIELEGKLVIKITIPNINKENYTVYKPYLIPIKTNDEYRTYIIETEYIATNSENSKTIELYKTELEACKIIKTDNQEVKICQQTQPVLTVPNSHCLSNLLVDPINRLNSCETFPIKTSSTFIRLEYTNSWLYILTKNTPVRIQCKDKTETIQLKETGLITFTETCKITTKEFSMEMAGKDKTIEIEQPGTTFTTFSEEDLILIRNNNTETNKQTITPITRFRNNINYNRDLSVEAQKISQLQAQAKKLSEESQNLNSYQIDMFNPYVITTTIITIIVIIVVIVVRLKKSKTKQKTEQIKDRVIIIDNAPKESVQTKNFEINQQGIKVV